MTEIVDLLKANSEGTLGEVTDEQLTAMATYYSVRIRKPGEEGKEASKKLLKIIRNDWPADFYVRFKEFVFESVKHNDHPQWRKNRELIEKMGVL